MKNVKHIAPFLIAGLLLSYNPAYAAFCGNCATERTQIINRIQLASSYSKQAAAYATQLQQYQAQLQNMMLNPSSIMPDDLNKLTKGIGEIMASGNSIGNSYADVNTNFSKMYNSPLADHFADRFKSWTSNSQDTLGSAMRAAGLQRDSYNSDTAALNALWNKSQSSKGTVSAIQTLSEIAVEQIQHTRKLEELLSSQNLASSTYMASQNAKEDDNMKQQQNIIKPFHKELVPVEKAQPIRLKLN
jgi:P-type conjugative transfer protein TrbJ